MWVRGLKPNGTFVDLTYLESHLMWVRGLKLARNTFATRHIKSHLMWVRGLKHKIALSRVAPRAVAPHVGAWIET